MDNHTNISTRACHGPTPVGGPRIGPSRSSPVDPAHHLLMQWAVVRPGPSTFYFGGPRSGPAHQFFGGWAAARPGPSTYQRMGRGPVRQIQRMGRGPVRPIELQKLPARPINFSNLLARPGLTRPMTFSARAMRLGLYMGRPAISVGGPVDLKGRPMYHLIPKGAR